MFYLLSPLPQVYDVTPYMEEHPGGDEVLLACTGEPSFRLLSRAFSLFRPAGNDGGRAGKDATADFDDIGHSDAAKELMRQYCVGEVDAATVPAKLGCAVLPAKGAADPAPRASTGQLLQLALPLLLVAMAFALQTFAKTKTETD
ncbi:cytochrome b5 isoform E [Hordeum vulgare]|nr:cytochrome b5 isoform E [Hordeum vulgare]